MARRRIFILYYIHLWNAVPFLMCIYVCYIRIISERERERDSVPQSFLLLLTCAMRQLGWASYSTNTAAQHLKHFYFFFSSTWENQPQPLCISYHKIRKERTEVYIVTFIIHKSQGRQKWFWNCSTKTKYKEKEIIIIMENVVFGCLVHKFIYKSVICMCWTSSDSERHI
jgi:hypothetical protein